jgi:hypothetical protein
MMIILAVVCLTAVFFKLTLKSNFIYRQIEQPIFVAFLDLGILLVLSDIVYETLFKKKIQQRKELDIKSKLVELALINRFNVRLPSCLPSDYFQDTWIFRVIKTPQESK